MSLIITADAKLQIDSGEPIFYTMYYSYNLGEIDENQNYFDQTLSTFILLVAQFQS